MRIDPNNPTASVAKSMPPNVATVGVATQHASDRGALASHSPAPHSLELANTTGATERRDTPVNRSTFIGVPTTSRRDGAGGPMNTWDIGIAAALRRNNPLLADRLRQTRARINLAFHIQEPVFVPTPSQRAMLGLQAGAARDGVSTMKAA